MNENFDFEDDLFDDDEDNFPCYSGANQDFKEPDQWTVISALNRVLNLAHHSGLSDEFWADSEKPLNYLKGELHMHNMQVIILSVLVEMGEAMSWRKLAKYLGCSRIMVMSYSDEIEELVKKRWLIRKISREMGQSYEGFALEDGVEDALRTNTPFVPQNIEGLSLSEFMEMMESRACNEESDTCLRDDAQWMIRICNANPQLAICQKVMEYKSDIFVQTLLLMVAVDYAQWADSPNEGLNFSTINECFPGDYICKGMRRKLKAGNHQLIKDGLIEMTCEDGMANVNRFMLTVDAKEALLDGYVPSRSMVPVKPKSTRGVKKCADIKAKTMFYNSNEQEQIDMLTNLLGKENLEGVQQRLEEEGMRKGFACLFYGGPGTGKTETVLQIARQTGRDIIQVDIAGMRDKFVGESEKNIKRVFSRYREACKDCEMMPILFFNEADALINKRSENIEQSVEKMDNAMQNIILQELEDLDGILIATTNLTSNLDKAFDRRFIFKVKFDKPGTEVKAKLWKSMLKNDISEDEAMELARRYDFSGGQIENIARKRTVDYILTGKKATFGEIDAMCQNEILDKKTELRRISGFNVHRMAS